LILKIISQSGKKNISTQAWRKSSAARSKLTPKKKARPRKPSSIRRRLRPKTDAKKSEIPRQVKKTKKVRFASGHLTFWFAAKFSRLLTCP